MALFEYAEKINEITRKAGELLEKLANDPEMRKPTRKGDGSPVTQADIKVSAYLVSALSQLGFPVVSEEALPETPPTAETPYFLVDPLDGTKYFSRGEPEYAICVGFLKEAKPFYGAIYDPIASRLFYAQVGEGAYCDGKPIGHQGVPSDGVRVYSSGFHLSEEKDRIVETLGIKDILEKGSALKFCDIAMGEVDLYMRFGPTSEWDTAAAQVILNEANCFLYEAHSRQPMAYGKKQYLNRGTVAGHNSQLANILHFLEQVDLTKRRQPWSEDG